MKFKSRIVSAILIGSLSLSTFSAPALANGFGKGGPHGHGAFPNVQMVMLARLVIDEFVARADDFFARVFWLGVRTGVGIMATAARNWYNAPSQPDSQPVRTAPSESDPLGRPIGPTVVPTRAPFNSTSAPAFPTEPVVLHTEPVRRQEQPAVEVRPLPDFPPEPAQQADQGTADLIRQATSSQDPTVIALLAQLRNALVPQAPIPAGSRVRNVRLQSGQRVPGLILTPHTVRYPKNPTRPITHVTGAPLPGQGAWQNVLYLGLSERIADLPIIDLGNQVVSGDEFERLIAPIVSSIRGMRYAGLCKAGKKNKRTIIHRFKEHGQSLASAPERRFQKAIIRSARDGRYVSQQAVVVNVHPDQLAGFETILIREVDATGPMGLNSCTGSSKGLRGALDFSDQAVRRATSGSDTSSSDESGSQDPDREDADFEDTTEEEDLLDDGSSLDDEVDTFAKQRKDRRDGDDDDTGAGGGGGSRTTTLTPQMDALGVM